MSDPNRFFAAVGNFPDINGSITRLNDGQYIIAWQGTDGDGQSIFTQRLDENGAPIPGVDAVRHDGTTTLTRVDKDPQVVALKDDGWALAWSGLTTTSLSSERVFVKRFDAVDDEQGIMQTLGSGGASTSRTMTLTALSDGGFAVAYNDSNDVAVTTFGPAGLTPVNTVALTNTPGILVLPDEHQQIAALPDGGFVVTWSGGFQNDGANGISGYNIYVQEFNADGTTRGAMTELDGEDYNWGANTDPQIAVLTDGSYVVAWDGSTTDGQGTDVFFQRFDVNGAAVGTIERLQATAGDINDIDVEIQGLKDGGFVVTWQANVGGNNNLDIYAQVYDANGVAIAHNPIRLFGETGNRIDWAQQVVALPDGVLPDGGFAIFWEGQTSATGYDIFYQTFDAAGNPVGEQQQFAAFPPATNDQKVQVVVDPVTGQFLAVWQSTSTDGQGLDIFTQSLAPICFVRGTRILTDRGEVAVEDLAPGDLVITLDHGPQPLRWVGQTTRTALGKMAPVRILRGTLGNSRDLWVSPQHRMLLRRADGGEVLAAAIHLVDGAAIAQVEGGTVSYFHLMFDRHQVILAEGAATESFFPGPMAWASLSDDAREELRSLFPDLTPERAERIAGQHGPGPVPGFGALARTLARRPEARAILQADPQRSTAA